MSSEKKNVLMQNDDDALLQMVAIWDLTNPQL